MSGSSSSSDFDSDDFTDQNILSLNRQNRNVLNDDRIDLLRLSKTFPDETIFHHFSKNLKADHVSPTWTCFPEYPFTLGLKYPFSDLILNFFLTTKLCFPQLMPMGWRLLHTLDQLNHHFGLDIGIPEISLMYQLRTHGSSRFVLQRRSGAPILVSRITFNEDEWRNRFFFVKRSSIPHGEILPLKWLPNLSHSSQKKKIAEKESALY
ncbi:hypothetical protein E3N88_33633 [Mikania micrantha]|uniref:Uncharacterized protein n=1 Tax=Mikania micrantha TaxID=192012 RepID=A0A5N6MCD6_9ASTR|nr:hypothetical protein E3N88_33633 [Mikania micrantha]